MWRIATEDQIWEQCRFAYYSDLSKDDANFFVLREDERPHGREYLIPNYLPLYSNGSFLIPASFIDDLDGRLRQAFGLTFTASRLRYMIGHFEPTTDSDGKTHECFFPAHYLPEAKADHVLVAAQFDRRLGPDIKPITREDLIACNLNIEGAVFYGDGAEAEVCRVDLILNLTNLVQQQFVESTLHQLQKVVDESDAVMQKFEAEKGFYRRAFERLMSYAKLDAQIEWLDDALKITTNTSPDVFYVRQYRYNNYWIMLLSNYLTASENTEADKIIFALSEIMNERDRLYSETI